MGIPPGQQQTTANDGIGDSAAAMHALEFADETRDIRLARHRCNLFRADNAICAGTARQ